MSVQDFAARFGGFTESYWFYDGQVELRYRSKEHSYYLFENGEYILQDGVTQTCHIIDKSEVLIGWACKMAAQKLMSTVPSMTLPTGEHVIPSMPYEEFEGLVTRAKTAHKEKLEEAADIGHVAHAWVESYIKSVLSGDESRQHELLAKFPDDERARNCCTAAIEWMQAHNVRWIYTERKIYSRAYQYAGTLDGVALVDSCDNLQCCKSPFKDHKSVIDWKSSNYLYTEYLLQTAAYQQALTEELGLQIDSRFILRLGKSDGEFEPWHISAAQFEEDFDGFELCLMLTRRYKAIKARMKARVDENKAIEKERVRIAKEAAQRIRCAKADKYKGSKLSKCLEDGTQCEACSAIYSARKSIDIVVQ